MAIALERPDSNEWREVVDATVLLAGVIGGVVVPIVVQSQLMQFTMV